MSDPTIDVEFGSTINTMLHSSGYHNDFHSAISEVFGSFKFIRSFRKRQDIVSRKPSRIKRRSTTQGFIDSRSESMVSTKSTKSLNESNQNREGKLLKLSPDLERE